MATVKYYLLYSYEDIRGLEHPDILPLKLEQTPFFESEAFRMIRPEDLPQVDNIGFLTPKPLRAVMNRMDLDIYLDFGRNPIKNIIKLYNPNVNLNQAVAWHGTVFGELWDWLTSSMGFPVGSYKYEDVSVFYKNAWIARREFVVEFLKFVKPAFEIVERAPEEWRGKWFSNAHYGGSLLGKGCMEKFGTPHYPFHPFIFERLICFFTYLWERGLWKRENAVV